MPVLGQIPKLPGDTLFWRKQKQNKQKRLCTMTQESNKGWRPGSPLLAKLPKCQASSQGRVPSSHPHILWDRSSCWGHSHRQRLAEWQAVDSQPRSPEVPTMHSPNHGTHQFWVSLAVGGYQTSGNVEGSCLFLIPNNLSWLPVQLKLAQHLIKTAGPYMHIDLPLSINFAHGLRSTPHT